MTISWRKFFFIKMQNDLQDKKKKSTSRLQAGTASWCNGQSLCLCSPGNEWIPFHDCQTGERAGSCSAGPSPFLPSQPRLSCRWQGLFFSSFIASTFPSTALLLKDTCVIFISYSSPLWVFTSLVSVACLPRFPSQWTPILITLKVVSVIMYSVTDIRKHSSNWLKP